MVCSLNANEGSFLAGYLAALMSKTHKIGFVGGQELDLIKKFYIGYAAGAKTADPSVEVLPAKYVGNWDNQDTGHGAGRAAVVSVTGADVIYHAAGRAGLGVLKCAKEQGKVCDWRNDGDQGTAKRTVVVLATHDQTRRRSGVLNDFRRGEGKLHERRQSLRLGLQAAWRSVAR